MAAPDSNPAGAVAKAYCPYLARVTIYGCSTVVSQQNVKTSILASRIIGFRSWMDIEWESLREGNGEGGPLGSLIVLSSKSCRRWHQTWGLGTIFCCCACQRGCFRLLHPLGRRKLRDKVVYCPNLRNCDLVRAGNLSSVYGLECKVIMVSAKYQIEPRTLDVLWSKFCVVLKRIRKFGLGRNTQRRFVPHINVINDCNMEHFVSKLTCSSWSMRPKELSFYLPCSTNLHGTHISVLF